MKVHPQELKTGLVLPGGGARAAFQVGVLKAIADLLPPRAANPFPVLSGTSAGAINSVVLASKARHFCLAVDALDAVWANFRCGQVYRTDPWTMLKSSLHWLTSMVSAGWIAGTPRSLLDNAPLRALLSRKVRFPRIQRAIEDGHLHAVAVTAAGYSSARSTTFFQAHPTVRTWSRTRRVGVRQALHLDHLMASIAVPMIFPPVLIGDEYFGDGAMRQATPLSPAIHLGADRILVIGVRNEMADTVLDPAESRDFPNFAQIAGYMLDTLFLDGLYADLERMTRINQLIDSVPSDRRTGALARMRPIDTMLVVPSRDLREIAHRHRRAMPLSVRMLLRGIRGEGTNESRLLSFLLFEEEYTRELIDLGYADAMRIKDELRDFVSGADVPRLFAPAWVRHDLSGYDMFEPAAAPEPASAL
ncbi:MAG TPA: patatin-like phospholipase family protein [Woeseiaceae bacterium]|nr:patatin-like phospholipase family protein [Woeseiaceae bacterium]